MASLVGIRNIPVSSDLARDPRAATVPIASDGPVLAAAAKSRRPLHREAAALVTEVLEHYRRGRGFKHFHLVQDTALECGGLTPSASYLQQSRLADLIATILVAMAGGLGLAENPTLGLLDHLIASGAIDDTDLIADILASDAAMVGHEEYVTGLGYARFGIVRTATRAPLHMRPAVRTPDLLPEPTLVPGIFEHHWVYFTRHSAAPRGILPAYAVRLRDACGLLEWESRTVYQKLSGKRRDFRLVAARRVTSERTREVVFEPQAFWQYVHGTRL